MAATRCEFTVHCLPDDPLIITMSSNHDSSHTRRKPPMWTRTKWSWRPALRRWMRRRWMRRSKRRRWRRLRLSKGIAEPEGEVDAVKAETQADESTCEHKTNHSSPVSTLNHSPTLVTITCFLNITCHPKVVGRQTQASFMLPCGWLRPHLKIQYFEIAGCLQHRGRNLAGTDGERPLRCGKRSGFGERGTHLKESRP